MIWASHTYRCHRAKPGVVIAYDDINVHVRVHKDMQTPSRAGSNVRKGSRGYLNVYI